MKRRLTDTEKKQLGYIIHYYRNTYFHDKFEGYEQYKQVDFSKNVCSQAQLSRLEHGEVLKDNDIYYSLLGKLNLKIDKVQSKLISEFDVFFTNILKYQNDDKLIINYNQYILAINKFQNDFRYNVIYTHYTYALEFIIYVINEEYEEAHELLEYIEGTVDILPKNYLIVVLEYIGRLYDYRKQHNQAIKYYLSSIEHMLKLNKHNPIIFMDIAYAYLRQGHGLKVISYLNQCNTIFEGTHNSNILERLYGIYGLLYLKNHYFDESRKYFRLAIKYSVKAKDSLLIAKNMYYMALTYYLESNIERAKQILIKAGNHHKLEKTVLLEIIMNDNRVGYEFNIPECRLVYDLYTTTSDKEIEEIYKKYQKTEIVKSEDLNILIKHKMLTFYKENKKYKKALKLLESS